MANRIFRLTNRTSGIRQQYPQNYRKKQTIPAGCVPRVAPISTTRHVCQDIQLPGHNNSLSFNIVGDIQRVERITYICMYTYLEHSLDDSENNDQINRISGSNGGEDRQDRGAEDSVTDQFHTPYLCTQQTTDQLRRNVSIKERTQNRATKFWAPVEFARLQSNYYPLLYMFSNNMHFSIFLEII